MSNKLKAWLNAQKKDAKILGISFAAVFVINIVMTREFFNAFAVALSVAFTVAIFINIFRFWRSVARKAGVPTITQPKDLPIVKTEEQEIVENLIQLVEKDIDIFDKENFDEIILQKIKEKNYLKNDWQIDYAKERIKKALKEHFSK